MEDYKEKYENALAKIKQIFDKGSKFVIRREVFESIFPELKESEDEKIRKEIINYFECQSRDEPERKGIHNRWIDWLEKQESRTSIDAAADNKSAIDDALWCVKQAYQTAKNENDTGTCWFAEKWLNDLRKRLR